MEIHISYLRKVCRVCGEVNDTGKKITYGLETIKAVIQEAFKNKEGCDLETDTEATQSRKVCQNCYKRLKKWDSDYNKYLAHVRKNPNSPKTFSTSARLPEELTGPLVHHDECVCVPPEVHVGAGAVGAEPAVAPQPGPVTPQPVPATPRRRLGIYSCIILIEC